MQHDFFEIESAFDFVSSDARDTNSALLSRTTGHIYYASEYGETDEDFPDEDAAASDEYVAIPHKHELDLGNVLGRRFVRECAPELDDEVRFIFSHKGAYAHFKRLLIGKGLLDQWHAYERAETQAALRKWCQENNIELADQATT